MKKKLKKIKIVFLGGRVLGYRCLSLLVNLRDKIDVKLVIGLSKDKGEISSDWNPALLPLAKKMGYPIMNPITLKNEKVIKLIKAQKVDVILNVSCDRIIPREILDIPKYGCINFHFGKLPKYRGRFIVTHMILNNEKVAVVTAHYIAEKVDSGDIIFEKPVKILPYDTAKSLYLRCTEAAVELFKNVIEALINGRQLPHRKQRGESSYYSFNPPNNCKVELNRSKDEIERFIRAVTFPPISYPWILINGEKYEVREMLYAPH